MIEVEVSGLAFDSMSNSPVVLLKERTGYKILPIWIGINEANVIALDLSGKSFKRPLTHDLMKAVFDGFNARLQKVIISSLKDNTFYAKFYILASENSIIEIDARPSDSIAMALKMKAPIYVSSELEESMVMLSQKSETDTGEHDVDTDPLDLINRLRNIKPEDFGDFIL